jgi:hypothetical protein
MNTLKYAKNLEEVGFSREQAEMTIGILSEVVESNLATREDMKDLRHEMQMLKSELIIKLGTMVIAAFTVQVGVFAAIVKFIISH